MSAVPFCLFVVLGGVVIAPFLMLVGLTERAAVPIGLLVALGLAIVVSETLDRWRGLR